MNSNWDLESEREFMENLLCQRFNFLLVFFGLILAGGFAAREELHAKIILWLGTIIVIPLSLTIAGAQWKLDRILRRICADKSHPISVIDAEGHGLSLRWIIGYLIPAICSLALLLGAIFSSLGKLRFAGAS